MLFRKILTHHGHDGHGRKKTGAGAEIRRGAAQSVALSAERSFHRVKRDRAYRQDRPGFEINRTGASLDGITAYHSRSIQTAANNYRPAAGGTNYPRYGNPELDALIDRFERTIPIDERLNVAAQANRHLTSQVVQLGLYYDVQPVMVDNRISRNFLGYTWDAHEWELAS